MKTVFSLFDDFSQAEAAYHKLRENGFGVDAINVILTKETAKNYMKQGNIRAEKSAGLPDTGTASQLAWKLGGEQDVLVSDVGDVYAAGKLANLLAETAANPGGKEHGILNALENFDIQDQTAETYRNGIKGGGVLLFVRTGDERASQAASLLREAKGKDLATTQ